MIRSSSSATAWLTVAAMLAFAANSLLCRRALGAGEIDAASFSSIRLISGAAALGAIAFARSRRLDRAQRPDWAAATSLFLYMVLFASAYLSLSAATGALILFGAVQLTMFSAALSEGERFRAPGWGGLLLALSGLVYLLAPGASAPSPSGAAMMVFAGIAWGVYSLRGRRAVEPIGASAKNFALAVPMSLAVSAVTIADLHVGFYGAALAVASGAITSGAGYVAWYAALRGLTATSAATVQLSVPVIAAFGGVLLLGEHVTLRLLIASSATLGGIAIVLRERRSSVARPPDAELARTSRRDSG
jgi:drug/metabolite transporter (DMT)-like permease